MINIVCIIHIYYVLLLTYYINTYVIIVYKMIIGHVIIVNEPYTSPDLVLKTPKFFQPP